MKPLKPFISTTSVNLCLWGKTWLQSESLDTMAVILQGACSLFWSWGFWSQTRQTRVLSWRTAMKLYGTVSAHGSATSGVRFQLGLRLPFNTLNSLPARARISELPSQSKQLELLSKHFKGSPKLQNEKAVFSTCCSRRLHSTDKML